MNSSDPKLTRDQLQSIFQWVDLTRENELNCGECLKHLGEFTEQTLAGAPVCELITSVEHHLALCPECREEFTALKRILESEG